jgi:replicative superfamily II helicase
VTPLRALSAQTEHSLSEIFVQIGYEVSGLYGGAANSRLDLDSLKTQQIVVSTPEKLDFALRNDPNILDDIGLVVIDEGHMLGPGEREVRYEVLIQRLLKRADADKRRLVCLSAMLPDGEQLNDFVSWLRADKPGDVVKNEWRPTRLRYGEIVLGSKYGRYALQIENQATFINRFVTIKKKVGPKGGETFFPKTSTDLALASAWRLVKDGHSVLIYCPLKKTAKGMAANTLKAIKNGFLPALPVDATAIQKAVNVGEEWLGPDHPVVLGLKVGVAIHHASLPKVFLNEIDILIRKRHVRVVAASPTLAQGLNICASCVLFQAVSRFDLQKKESKMISPQEFANVAGRAGRAFVDVDGQVIGIVTTPNSGREWKEAKERASDRNLQSGIFLILGMLYGVLKRTYFPTAANIAKGIEYILNHADLWENFAPKEPTEDWRFNLDTLDVAIISMCGEYEPDEESLPEILDAVLNGSFMRRELSHQTDAVQMAADALLKSRAKFIWSKSTAPQRKGYFFAGVGLQTGLFLDANADQLNASLKASTS